MPTTTLSDLQVRLGTLSKPGKMPGYAWGIPAKYCITGAKLRDKANSPCSKCYALKGRYLWPNVMNAYEKRYQAWLHEPDWVPLMTKLIDRSTKPEEPYFRWFDSGDLQGVEMLCDIVEIAWSLPKIRFWLPTQERALLTEYVGAAEHLPPNLAVRASHPQIGGPRPQGWDLTSGVLSKTYKKRWKDRTARSTKTRHFCPAPTHEDKTCGSCRACWDPTINTVVYLEH